MRNRLNDGPLRRKIKQAAVWFCMETAERNLSTGPGLKGLMHDDRQLWDLLGRAPRAPAPPFFSARVMRAVGASAAPHPSWLEPLLRWLAPASVAALFAAALLTPPPAPVHTVAQAPEFTTLELVGLVSPQDYDVLTAAGSSIDNGFLTAGL